MLVPREEGAYRCFALFQFTTQSFNLGCFKFIPLQNTVCAASNPTPALPHRGRGLFGGYPGGGWQMVCRFGFRFTYTLSAQVYVSGDRQWDKLRFAMFGRRRCLDVKSLTLPPPQPSPAAGFALQGRGLSGSGDTAWMLKQAPSHATFLFKFTQKHKKPQPPLFHPHTIPIMPAFRS